MLTRDLGVVSAVAKGAAKPKSKFGARLQLMSEGMARLYVKPNRDLNTLAEFEVVNLRHDLAADVRRYASASALAELVLRCAPAERNDELFGRVVAYLDSLAVVPEEHLEITSLSALWGIVCALGFEPAMDGCARDGRSIPDGAALFSIAEGGLLCAKCAKGATTAGAATSLQSPDRTALELLIAGRCEDVGRLSPRHAAAHRHLLVRFVTRHVSEDRELKALSFWESLPWDDT
jgi:DNA repair protein RecO (recombination protein O)